jgi:O-antigen ligase
VAARIDPASASRLAALGLCAAIVGLLAGIDPKFAIAAAIAAGFVLLVSVDLAAGLAVFGFFSFLEILELGNVISVGKLGGALLALGWLAVLATRRDAEGNFLAMHPWMSGVLGLFLGWSLLSTGWAAEPTAALATTGRLVLNAVLFLIVFTAIRTRQQAEAVAAAFVAGALAATAYGLTHPSATVEAGRLASSSGLDPNELAAVLVAGVVLGGALAANLGRSPGLRLAALSASAFCLLGIFLTDSRGGIVALGVTLLAAIVLAGPWRIRILAATAVIAGATFLYFGAVASPEARGRIESVTQGEAQLQNGRMTIWTVGWRMAQANPVAGVGAGNFQHASKEYLLQPGVLTRTDQILLEAPKVAHNTYLSLLSELGIVGLALFLTLVAFSLRCSMLAARNFRVRGDPNGEVLARAFAIALVGILAADFFISQELKKELWLLLGFGPALLSISRGPDRSRAAQRAGAPALAAYSSS